MRRAMICVSVMLAVIQVWPMVFGRSTPSVVAVAAPAHPNAEVIPVPAARLVRTPAAVPVAATAASARPAVAMLSVPGAPRPAGESCYRRYQRSYALCTTGKTCQMRAADDWDLCEATGLWPS